jgi:hypothetical protein
MRTCLTGNNQIRLLEGPATPLFIILDKLKFVISLYRNLRLNSRFDNDGYVNNMVLDRRKFCFVKEYALTASD